MISRMIWASHHAFRLFRSLSSFFFALYGLNEGLFYLLYYIHVNTIVFLDCLHTIHLVYIYYSCLRFLTIDGRCFGEVCVLVTSSWSKWCMNHTQYHRTGHVRMKCIFTVKSMCKKNKNKTKETTTT